MDTQTRMRLATEIKALWGYRAAAEYLRLAGFSFEDAYELLLKRKL
jgi:hypothetical protein